MKKWQTLEVDKHLVERLAQEAQISSFAAHLLVARGMTERASADAFFNSDEISSPFEIADMKKAVDTIREAVEKEQVIMVYGDYDCDGITATVILVTYLQMIGANVKWYIPSRDEGYGLSFVAVDRIKNAGADLIITVDNGISAFDEAKYIKEMGMKLVITDHHQVSDRLPQAEAVVNPHRSDDYSECKDLAGCGVALKLAMALEDDVEGMLDQFADLAAIGTVADIVPLVGENRIIVRRGLETMLCSENLGVYALLQEAGIKTEDRLTSSSLGFSLCPRINAAGRFAHPLEAVELFLCESQSLAQTKAEKLTLLNNQRRQAEQIIFDEIEERIGKDRSIINKRIIVVSGSGWSHGVIGIVASKLLNKYSKPAIVITIEGDTARASARSVSGFSLYKMLDSCKDMLMRYGGHTNAAGFTLLTSRIEEFEGRIFEYARKNYPTMPFDTVYADKEVTAAELTLENVEAIDYFKPFGEGNPMPVFMLKKCTIKSMRPLKDGKYLSFTVSQHGSRSELNILNFSSGFSSFRYSVGDCVDLLVNAEINEYNDKRSVSLRLKDVRLSALGEEKAQEKLLAARSAYDKLSTNEFVEPKLISRIIPDIKQQRQAYDIIRNCTSLSFAAEKAFSQGLNYCMFRVCLDVFEEKGLIKIDICKDSVELIPGNQKVDLSTSEHLRRLERQIEKSARG